MLARCHGNDCRRAFRNNTRATTSFGTIPVVIGSSVLSSVISFHVMFGPMLKPRVPTDLDHERDITLAIHAAVPDLITDTNRHAIQAGSGCFMALASRFEWNSRAKPV